MINGHSVPNSIDENVLGSSLSKLNDAELNFEASYTYSRSLNEQMCFKEHWWCYHFRRAPTLRKQKNRSSPEELFRRALESSRAWAGMGSVQAFVSSPSFRRASSETWTSSPPVTGDGLLRILRGRNWRRHAEKQPWSEVAVFCARSKSRWALCAIYDEAQLVFGSSVIEVTGCD